MNVFLRLIKIFFRKPRRNNEVFEIGDFPTAKQCVKLAIAQGVRMRKTFLRTMV